MARLLLLALLCPAATLRCPPPRPSCTRRALRQLDSRSRAADDSQQATKTAPQKSRSIDLLDPGPAEDRPQASDYATLAVVPAVWGTYAPLVRLIYGGAVAPPPLLFNAASFAVSLLSLATARAVRGERGDRDGGGKGPVLRAGAELGLWLFLGSSLQLQGLQSTSSIRAAVLVQTTTVIVPLLESAVKRRLLPLPVYASCALATLGVVILSSQEVSVHSSLALAQGDLLVLAAALCYSTHVLRLGSLAADCDPLDLSLAKSLFELLFCLLAIGLSVAAGGGQPFSDFFGVVRAGGWDHLVPLLGALLWNGAAATALTTWAQSTGQVCAVGPCRARPG